MQKLPQIAYAALLSTSRRPRWWILALAQVAGFFIIGQAGRHHWLFLPWLLPSAIFLVPITVWFWLDIDAVKLRLNTRVSMKSFIGRCFVAGAIMFCSVSIILVVRLASGSWIFLTLFSSLVAATAALAMLYAVLCGQNFASAWVLALDTWNKKISLAAAAAFILIVAHGISFAFVHGIWDPSLVDGEFSAFSHSATIWILLIILLFLIAFLAALLNCFLVFFFLEIIGRKKDPEAAQATAQTIPAFEART